MAIAQTIRPGGSARRLPAGAILLALLVTLVVTCGCQKKANQADRAVTSITTASGIEMVLLPAGDFVFGDETGDDDEKPAGRTHVTGFCMDKFEVTQKAYETLTGANPAKFKGADRPVERVSWLDAIKYCNLRSMKEGLKPCYNLETQACDFTADGYRLPTEAEWEYACRAGSRTPFSFGGDSAGLDDFAWSKANAREATHPVGQRRPNAFGLFDMHGNVAEWCQDIYAEDGYRARAGGDPRGLASGDRRVLRGGSWRSPSERCRSSARGCETPVFADACFGSDGIGFRCVKLAPPGRVK